MLQNQLLDNALSDMEKNMEIIAINGSPRKKGNSAAMLKSWLTGAKEENPASGVQWIDLYDLAFTGCRSCFACKRKNGLSYGECPIKDGIHDLIRAVYSADAVGISYPIYFGELDAYTRCFLERAMFCKTTYRKNHDSLAPKPVPVTMIYTMNCPEELAARHHYTMHWDDVEWYIANAFRHPVTRVCAYNTYQFDNYDDYEMEMFVESEKRKYRDEHFQNDLAAAFQAGKTAI